MFTDQAVQTFGQVVSLNLQELCNRTLQVDLASFLKSRRTVIKMAYKEHSLCQDLVRITAYLDLYSKSLERSWL